MHEAARIEGTVSQIVAADGAVIVNAHALPLAGIASVPANFPGAPPQMIQEAATVFAQKLRDRRLTVHCTTGDDTKYFCEIDPQNGGPQVDLARMLIRSGLVLPGSNASRPEESDYVCDEEYACQRKLGVWSRPESADLPHTYIGICSDLP
jgi:hypothetical protein